MDLTRFSPCCCSCRCSGCGVQPCGHAADVRRSARFSPRTDSVTGGYRRLTHLLRVTAHAHDVPVVPLWPTDYVCSCPIGRRRDYLRERREACAKTKRPYKEESEGRGDAARAAGPGPSERPGRTGRTAARVSAARSSSTRAAATSTSMFARGVAVWGAEKHFFNLKSASRGHFRSIPGGSQNGS